MLKIIVSTLIYYLPLVFNVLLSVLAYNFLPTSEATILISAQFLSAAGVGLLSSVCGQLPLIYSGKLEGAPSYLYLLVIKTAPVALTGMVILSLIMDGFSVKVLCIALLLTMIDSFLLAVRTVNFSAYTASSSLKDVNFRQLLVISLPRMAVCFSPLTMDLNVVIAIMLGALLFILCTVELKSVENKFEQTLKQHNLIYLMLAGFLNGCLPYFLMTGLNSQLESGDLVALIVLRIALAFNSLVRIVIDSMIAGGVVRMYEILLSCVVIILASLVIFLDELALVMASLPILVYVSKGPYLKNIVDHHFSRSLITPISLLATYFFFRLYYSEVDSLIAGFLISSIVFMLVMRKREQTLHHNFIVSILSLMSFIYVY